MKNDLLNDALRQAKKTIKTLYDFQKVAAQQEHYSSGGGGTMLHVTCWTKRPANRFSFAARLAIQDHFRVALLDNGVYRPSVHLIIRDSENEMIQKGLPDHRDISYWAYESPNLPGHESFCKGGSRCTCNFR